MFLLFAVLFAFVHGGLSVHVSYNHKHLGCFTDKADRAMPYLGWYPINPVGSCADRALKDGYKTFGVQAHSQCFGGPQASHTYNKYGSSSACSKNSGGSWANDVFQYPDHVHIGCFKDKSERAFPKHLGTFSGMKSVEQCAAIARAKHFPIFAVQYGGECWTGERSEQDYAKYGKGTECQGGVGGHWLNDVYSFEPYRHVGCYKDIIGLFPFIPRAISYFAAALYPDKTAVANCAHLAMSKKAIGFAVQDDLLPWTRQCYIIGNAGVKYQRFGKVGNCGGGVGALLANDAYLFY